MSAFVQVYQGGDRPLVAVPTRVSLVDSNGSVVMDRRQDLAVAQFIAKTRAANIIVPVPVERLTSGEYLLSLETSLNGAVARRHTRIHVRPPAP